MTPGRPVTTRLSLRYGLSPSVVVPLGFGKIAPVMPWLLMTLEAISIPYSLRRERLTSRISTSTTTSARRLSRTLMIRAV